MRGGIKANESDAFWYELDSGTGDPSNGPNHRSVRGQVPPPADYIAQRGPQCAFLSKRYVVKIEHGKANVTVDVVERLVRLFRCDWKDILGEIAPRR